MSMEGITYVNFRNETFLDFGVVAQIPATPASKSLLHDSDVFGTAQRHRPSISYFFPLERADGKGFAWDPIAEGREGQITSEIMGVYTIPGSLQKFNERLPGMFWPKLIAYEVGVRNTKMTQVVSGYFGEPLCPFAKNSTDQGKMDETDWHCRAWFADDKLARVRVEPEKKTLSIDRTFSWLDESGSAIIVQSEIVAADIVDRAFKSVPPLPKELNAWQPALEGLHRRLHCYRTSCNTSHFYDASVPE